MTTDEAVRIVREQVIPTMSTAGAVPTQWWAEGVEALKTVLAALKLLTTLEREWNQAVPESEWKQMQRERDEARAEISRLKGDSYEDLPSRRVLEVEIERLRVDRDTWRDGYDRLEAKLAEARAEVTRLTDACAGIVAQVEDQRRRAEQAEAALDAERERSAKLILCPAQISNLKQMLSAEQERHEADLRLLREGIKTRNELGELLLAERERSERLSTALKIIATCFCPVRDTLGRDCGLCISCIARAALAPAQPEERHWQDDAEPKPGRAQTAYQAERKEKP